MPPMSGAFGAHLFRAPGGRAASVEPVILIVDQDFAFVWWLGKILAGAGLAAIPALDCEEASRWIKGLKNRVDTIILNASLPGSDELRNNLCHAGSEVRIILIQDQTDDAGAAAGAELDALERPRSGDLLTTAEWSRKLSAVLARPAIRSNPRVPGSKPVPGAIKDRRNSHWRTQ